ncbi:TonB family protein [Methylosinus sp. Ce-a6]|uniref:TonB family protein n=1 Tax=Methylosinus sp. Ce-a6 TaxID=2172005 RepID=UPI001AED5F00|nr:TonB family protein [Methylosinus sp. Ce-a6]
MSMQAAAMTAKQGERRPRVTIYHGFAASLALHALLSLPYMFSRIEPDEDDRSTLVFEMDGLVSDEQADEKVQKDTAGHTQQDTQSAVRAQPTPPSEQKPQADVGAPLQTNSVIASAKAFVKPESGGSTQVNGADRQQAARTIAQREVSEETLLRAYCRQVSKKVHARLIYPEEGRRSAWRGAAKVSFFIEATGQIRADSIKLVSSSGQPRLDAAAMQTVRASAPLAPPPRPMTFAIDVGFDPER